MSDESLTNTAYVLLGFLNAHPHSGYDMKRLADHSTRFFWQISYGQIYPELKRLVEKGLVAQEASSRGMRARNLYRITAKGRTALRSWLAEPTRTGSFEMRDELLLKLFFSDAGGTRVKRRVLEQMKLREEAMLAELKAIEPHARQAKAGHGQAKLDVLMGGLKIHETYLSHLKELLKDLS